MYEKIEVLREEFKREFNPFYKDLSIASYIDTDRDFLINAELYQLFSRKYIIDSLTDKSIKFIDCIKEFETDLVGDSHKELLHSKGYYIYSCTDDLLIIVTDYYNPNKAENISMSFYSYSFNIEVMYITPYNALCLAEGEDYKFITYDPIIYFKRIVKFAIDCHCSDIHFVPTLSKDGTKDVRIYFRQLNDYNVTEHSINVAFSDEVLKTVVKQKTLGEEMDLNSSHGVKTSYLNPFGDGSADLRVTVGKTISGLTGVIRIQTISTLSKDIENLGFNGIVVEKLRILSEMENGLTLVTGPQRTGKNTTIFAMVNRIKNKPIKICDYSSPVETIMEFAQVDYGGSADELYNYIDLAKKQDLDIAIVNELPQSKVAFAVIELVNSSVGVFTTFHINRIWHLPYKLRDYFGDRYKDLITQINGVCNQKMFVHQCQECQSETAFDNQFNTMINKFMLDNNIKYYKTSKGCSKCSFTGKANKVQPYAEILVFDDTIKAELLKCDKVYDMEKYIKDLVYEEKLNLETYISEEILSGRLHPTDAMKLL